jgi:2-dehydropantoate 2-reductase
MNKGPREDLVRILIQEIGPVVRRLAPADSRCMVDDLDPERRTPLFADDSLMRRARLTTCKTGANTSSMLQDVQQKRQTEIDYINGYIVSYAERFGLKCANNKTLVEMVKSRTVIKDEDVSSYFHGAN